MKRLAIIFSTALVMALSSSIWAAKPDRITYSYDDLEYLMVECDGYDVLVDAYVRATETTFYNKDGEAIRWVWTFNIEDSVWYNSENPEIFIQQGKNGTGENFHHTRDLVTGAWKTTGLFARITVPGVGPVHLAAGHQGLDSEGYYYLGAWILPDDGTGSVLCDLLSP